MSGLTLEIVEGRGVGRVVVLNESARIGRDPACDVVLDDELVSRIHLRLTPTAAGARAEDLDSRNGTFLNGNPLYGAAELSPGDQLVIGVTVFEVRTPEDVRLRPTAVRERPPALAEPARNPDYVPPTVGLAPMLDSRTRQLDALLDRNTKRRARTAPLGMLLLVVFAILLFLALR